MPVRKFQNPPPFRATGRGYFNKLPNLEATKRTATASLVNIGLDKADKNKVMYLFVTGIRTGWEVAGTYGQSAGARTFYPRNLTQQDFTIEGVVGNQHQYDRLVEFIIAHHQSATDVKHPRDDVGTTALRFRLHPYRVNTGRKDRAGNTIYQTIYSGLSFDGYILNIRAGHERFMNAPTYQINMRISDDHLQKAVHQTTLLDQQLTDKYLESFGQFYKSPKRKSTGQTASGDTTPDGTGSVFFTNKLSAEQLAFFSQQ
jgi:hypothetical protein